MSYVLDICLKRTNKIYHEGDTLSGIFIVDAKGDLSHNGITLTLEGNMNLHFSKSFGSFDTLNNATKPPQLLFASLDLAIPGKLPSGRTEIPFEVPLNPKSSSVKLLYETYHGVFINIQYTIKADITRSILLKSLHKSCEFIVQYKKENAEKAITRKLDFKISPSSIQKIKDESRLPVFEIQGFIESDVCCLSNPFMGQLSVIHCDKAIQSIELQLIRVESCECAEGYSKEATEIQNIQIADGNICKNIPIPIYMTFPRLFTCPSIITNNIKIEFQINIVIIFDDNYMISENFPVKLTRY